MTAPALDDFAARLIHQVRDQAIRNCDLYLRSPNTPAGRRWNQASSGEDLHQQMIADCVDEAIFWLLQAIDQEALNLTYSSPTGERLELCADGLGELSGWYMGSGGWRSMYSQQRYYDDQGESVGE